MKHIVNPEILLKTYTGLRDSPDPRLATNNVDWAIDPETLDALVPNMILQPLVENSIRHGVAPKEGGGRIEIFSRCVNDQLLIEIRDDGVGAAGAAKKENGAGIGLINSRTRLEHLYGEAQKFDVKTPAHGGWCVTMLIPFREQPDYGEERLCTKSRNRMIFLSLR